MKIKNRLYMSAGISIILAMIGISVGGCQEEYTGPVEEITIGVGTAPLSLLIWVAENEGYFADNGLDVEMTYNPVPNSTANCK